MPHVSAVRRGADASSTFQITEGITRLAAERISVSDAQMAQKRSAKNGANGNATANGHATQRKVGIQRDVAGRCVACATRVEPLSVFHEFSPREKS